MKGINLIPLFREIIKILGLLIIPIFLFIHFKWEGILYLIIYFQLLLIEIQAEISLRQNELYSLQYEPIFEIKPITNGNISVKNISKNPAYFVGIQRILDSNLRPLPPSEWSEIEINLINMLSPNEEKLLLKKDNLDFLNTFFREKLTIEMGYTNTLNKINAVGIRGLKENILQLNPPLKSPGFLLNIFESLNSFFKYIWYFKMRK